MEIQMHPARPQNSHQPDETELPEGEADVSRSKFLRGCQLDLGAGTLGAAATAAGAPAEAHPGKGVGPGLDPNPEYRRPQITRLKTVTGPGITTRFRMEATDLGAPAVTPDGRILVIFGDTFEEAAVGSSWWRSPVGLFADPKRKLKDRKSTRLNSSHVAISYAVFCL